MVHAWGYIQLHGPARCAPVPQTWALGKLGCRVGKSRIDPAVSGHGSFSLL